MIMQWYSKLTKKKERIPMKEDKSKDVFVVGIPGVKSTLLHKREIVEEAFVMSHKKTLDFMTEVAKRKIRK